MRHFRTRSAPTDLVKKQFPKRGNRGRMCPTTRGTTEAAVRKRFALESFPFRWIRNGALDSCFDAFSSREPVSTSLENALTGVVAFALIGVAFAPEAFRPISLGQQAPQATHEVIERAGWTSQNCPAGTSWVCTNRGCWCY